MDPMDPGCILFGDLGIEGSGKSNHLEKHKGCVI